MSQQQELNNPAQLWRRPEWVMSLGMYGRMSYEWKRAHQPEAIKTLQDPESHFRNLDRELPAMVGETVTAWLEHRNDLDVEVIGLPREFAAPDADQELEATRAAEIAPTLAKIYLPTPEAVGMIGDTRLSEQAADLLRTENWETRPSMMDLRAEVQTWEEQLRLGLIWDLPSSSLLRTPWAMFPTELAIAHQTLTQLNGQPIDLFDLYN